MHIHEARILVASTTGTIGSALTAELGARGARLALAARDPHLLAQAAEFHHSAATALFEAYDTDSCARAVHTCAAALGGWTRSSRRSVSSRSEPRRPLAMPPQNT
ncbi:hypothetical protein [Streptomyces sp. CB01635]|uniref:hypothetical protein n=1 Tax=unclassified Streptomyces TaxID=2593676 RepID=UPI001F430E3A|nr:hypothetical protein [Streptomyces sp. CB01635]